MASKLCKQGWIALQIRPLEHGHTTWTPQILLQKAHALSAGSRRITRDTRARSQGEGGGDMQEVKPKLQGREDLKKELDVLSS